MLTGELKKVLIDCVTKIVLQHQERKMNITDEDIKMFMTPRKLQIGKANFKK